MRPKEQSLGHIVPSEFRDDNRPCVFTHDAWLVHTYMPTEIRKLSFLLIAKNLLYFEIDLAKQKQWLISSAEYWQETHLLSVPWSPTSNRASNLPLKNDECMVSIYCRIVIRDLWDARYVYTFPACWQLQRFIPYDIKSWWVFHYTWQAPQMSFREVVNLWMVCPYCPICSLFCIGY